jgi:hypothetical protein
MEVACMRFRSKAFELLRVVVRSCLSSTEAYHDFTCSHSLRRYPDLRAFFINIHLITANREPFFGELGELFALDHGLDWAVASSRRAWAE